MVKFLNNDSQDKKEVQEDNVAPKGLEETVDRSPRASRSSDKKTFDRATFRRPNDLKIPEALEKAFEDRGYYLYWVSVVDNKSKSFDNSKLNYYLSIGGDLVTAKEIKDIDRTFLAGLTQYAYREEWADENERGDMHGIRKEHLVLIKLPLEYREFKREENRTLVKDQLATAQHEYKQKEDAFVKDFKHGSSNLKLKKGFFEGN